MKEQRIELEKNYSEEIKVFKKIGEIVYDLGSNFTTYNAGELSEKQFKLAGYKFYLSDFIGELNRLSEAFKLKIKEYKAKEWQNTYNELLEKLGKVSNKEIVENALLEKTIDLVSTQIEYDTMHARYKMKLNSVDDILTACAQRIKSLQDESKYSQ